MRVCVFEIEFIFEWIEHNQSFTFGSDDNAHDQVLILAACYLEDSIQKWFTNTNNDQDFMSIFQKAFWWWGNNVNYVNYRYSFIVGHAFGFSLFECILSAHIS